MDFLSDAIQWAMANLTGQDKASIQQKADVEAALINLLYVFPTWTYKSNPTIEQIRIFAERLAPTYTLDQLYHIFASGAIPGDIDAVARELSPNWRPVGTVVDSTTTIARLQSGE